MPRPFGQVVVFVVMAILVALFSWIYLRDRRRQSRLWLVGWIAILAHFAAGLPVGSKWLSEPCINFLKLSTLEIGGVSFLLSVSEVYTNARKRLVFIGLVGLPAVFYTGFVVWGLPHAAIFCPLLLLTSSTTLMAQAFMHYDKKSSAYLYSTFLLFTPFSLWAMLRAIGGRPLAGMILFISVFFLITGILYWRHYRRATPGVITTSISFAAWGLVFPVAEIFTMLQVGPSDDSLVWDLPKYFVAFGMILTLFEDETELASRAAHQYRVLFEGNLAGVYVSTFEGKLLDCNSAFLNMYGFRSKEEALSNHTVSLYLEPADRQRFLELLNRDGQVINYECAQRKRDGSVFWILERATVVADPEGPKAFEGTSIDITERKLAELALKQSEERFATVFRNSPVGCAIISPEGEILNINEHALKILGMPIDQVVGKTSVEIGFMPSQEHRDLFFERLRSEGSIKNLEVEFKDSFGSRHIGLYFATLVRVGEKDCIFGMYLDRTEQHKLEAKFLQSQKMEALGRLAGGVAHDFNNLLGVIGGYAELLEARLGRDDGHRKYCSKIIETTQRASGLTRQLLTFSRKEIMRPAPLQVDQAVRDLAGILSRLIGEHIELRTNLRASGTIIIDKTHFEQIVLNIVVNARDAMPHGGVLSIETLDQQRKLPQGPVEGQGCVVMRIRDTGVGMDEQTRQQAFEPFYTTKEMGRGTGLGLSTVYGIVQQCGGEIGIESKLGKGTEITVVLPAAMAREMAEEAGEVEELVQGSGHILLVEDEADLRHANAEFLISLGYSVTCAASGPEALQVAGRYEGIDLVISDVVMPKMSGREFADRLLQDRPNTKVLFVSGYADDVVLQAGISTLGTPFLQKPFSLKQLGSKVR
ncbi:MAG TPA: PAS domain S-box protein, partial [Candidatus Angelobacter sp.]|nr:PAS domain S-box protein [Candidatus Angelobacter sp.]